MMRTTFAARLLLLFLLANGWNASAAAASAAEPLAAVALVSAGRGLLEWTPLVESEGMTLTLADPQGVVRTHHFAPGEAPALSLFDTQGAPLPDGTYTWELRATPRGTAPLVQSGYFTISGGNLVAPDLAEPFAADPRVATAPDQMVSDDLIIDGKGCIGLGCVNNEVFGTEALRLKQSVVRLRFQDTSTNASFPSNDWQITVNDSASGGANRFSIEDVDGNKTPLTIRAGAPDNSVYVDSAGRVGLGTATPAAQLHVSSSSSGGKALFENTNPTAAPREMFEVRNKGGAAVIFDDTNDPARWANTAFGPNFLFNNQDNSGVEYIFGPTGDLTVAGNVIADNVPPSSRELKHDFVAVDPGVILAKLVRMPITEWAFKEDPQHRRHIGPTVEDFSATFGLGTNGQSLVVTDVNGVALAAVQGLHALMEEQRQVIDRQQELIGKLEERLRRLEAQEQPE